MRHIFLAILFLTQFALADYATDKRIIAADIIQGTKSVENYIKDSPPKAPVTKGWKCYADTAGTRPLTGTGGVSTGVTWTATNVTPLKGPGSFVFTKDAVNRQGKGCSYDFKVDAADKAKVLDISVSYLVNSGTFVAGTNTTDSDLIFYILDITNSRLIEPSSFKLLSNSTTLTDTYRGTFQTSSDSVNYRLIAHVASTSASAFSLKFGEIAVSPSVYVYGSPVTDFAPARSLPAITGTGSGTLVIGTGGGAEYRAEVKQIGDEAIIKYYLKMGSVGAGGITGAYFFPFPNGIVQSNFVNLEAIGYGDMTITGTVNPYGRLIAKSYLTNNGFIVEPSDSGLLGGSTLTNAHYLTVTVRIKVQGWSSSVQMSDGSTTAVVSALYNASGATGAVTNITFASRAFDTSASFGTNSYTIPVAGFYEVSAGVSFLLTQQAQVNLNLFKNGTLFAVLDQVSNGGGVSSVVTAGKPFQVDAKAGDIFAVQWVGTVNTVSMTSNGTNFGFFSIKRLAGPQTIAASDEVSARYTSSAGQSLTAGVDTIIDFGTRVYDTHGAVTTGSGWKFTAPIAGKYNVNALVVSGNLTWGSGTATMYGMIFKNGAIYANGPIDVSKVAGTFRLNALINTTIYLLAGETIDYRVNQAGTSGGIFASANHVYIDIVRMK